MMPDVFWEVEGGCGSWIGDGSFARGSYGDIAEAEGEGGEGQSTDGSDDDRDDSHR